MYNFSVVTYFDPETTKQIQKLQHRLSEITGSKGAHSAWIPHITISSGITVVEDELIELYKNIENILITTSQFSIFGQGFAFMDNWSGADLGFSPYVVYIQLDASSELTHLASRFEKEIVSKYPIWYEQPQPYTPHITLAYKDLTQEGYHRAQEYLKGKVFEQEIGSNNVCLAVEEAGKWREFKRFHLPKS